MLIKNALKTTMSAALSVSLIACSNKGNQKEISALDVASINSNANLTPEEKSERTAKAAEQLMTYQGFAYANDVADLSLQQNPNNLRAQLVKAILGPLMVQKGIFKRVKGLADLDNKAAVEYVKQLAKFEEETPNSTAKEFLLDDGQASIKNEADIQAYIDSMAESFKVIREFAKNNKNSQVTVMASDAFLSTMTARFKEGCTVSQVGYYRYETNCPDIKGIMEITLNRADFEAIQHIAAGYELYFSLVNSYNLTGAIDKAIELNGKKEDAQKTIDDLLKNKDFATIRTSNGFQKVKDMGIDAIAGARWIMKNQNSLCPMGTSDGKNRIGMLLNQGLCTKKANAAEDSKNLSLISDVLAGRIIDDVELGGKTEWKWDAQRMRYVEMIKNSYKTSLKPVALFETPITDLRSIAPQTRDKCGNVIAIQDSTLAGVFVKGDFNAYLAAMAECK